MELMIMGILMVIAFSFYLRPEVKHIPKEKPVVKVKERRPKEIDYNRVMLETLQMRLIQKGIFPTKKAIRKEGLIFDISAHYSGKQRMFYFKNL